MGFKGHLWIDRLTGLGCLKIDWPPSIITWTGEEWDREKNRNSHLALHDRLFLWPENKNIFQSSSSPLFTKALTRLCTVQQHLANTLKGEKFFDINLRMAEWGLTTISGLYKWPGQGSWIYSMPSCWGHLVFLFPKLALFQQDTGLDQKKCWGNA